MTKYKYWHIIKEVDKDFQKTHPDFKVGEIITHYRKADNECISMRCGNKLIECAYVLVYLGRVPKDIHGKELVEILKNLKGEKI